MVAKYVHKWCKKSENGGVGDREGYIKDPVGLGLNKRRCGMYMSIG